MDASKIISPDFSSLIEKWPSAFVARCEVERFTGGFIKSRYLANLDCQGKGPERIRIGRKVGYSVESFVRWLELRSEVLK